MSERNSTDEVLGWLETIASLFTRFAEWRLKVSPTKTEKQPKRIKLPPPYKLVAPKVITSLKQDMLSWFEKQPISVIIIFYSVFIILYFFVSKLTCLVVVTGTVLTIVVIFQYEVPVVYHGIRGKLFIGLVWVFMAMAITAPLYTPIYILDGIVSWAGAHDG